MGKFLLFSRYILSPMPFTEKKNAEQRSNHMEEQSKIFREKSLERISSPEQLNQYIRTTSPSVWVILSAVVLFLVGIIVWATFDTIKTASDVGIRAGEGADLCYLREEDYEKLTEESYVSCEDMKFPILSVDGPLQADSQSDSFLMHAAGIGSGEWYYTISLDTPLADGSYKTEIVFEEVSPIRFIVN